MSRKAQKQGCFRLNPYVAFPSGKTDWAQTKGFIERIFLVFKKAEK